MGNLMSAVTADELTNERADATVPQTVTRSFLRLVPQEAVKATATKLGISDISSLVEHRLRSHVQTQPMIPLHHDHGLNMKFGCAYAEQKIVDYAVLRMPAA